MSHSDIILYTHEVARERLGLSYDDGLINSLMEKLKSEGTLEEADNLIKKEIEDEKRSQLANKASAKLFEILKDFTIWEVGKFDEDLKEISKVLKENDDLYSSRIFLYEQLMELPKYKKMDKRNKIRLAMQLGALDMNDLSYHKVHNENNICKDCEK